MKRVFTIVLFVVLFLPVIKAQVNTLTIESADLINELDNKQFDPTKAEQGRNEIVYQYLQKYYRGLNEKTTKQKARAESITCSVDDSLALVAFYNKMNGVNWTNKDNWLSETPVRDWWGVTVENSRVTAIEFYINYDATQNVTGNFAEELFGLDALEVLNLARNSVTGAIPSAIEGLSSLKHLDLSWNQLSGQIPTELASLSELEFLHLGSNQLTGGLIPELGNLSKLRNLIMWNNQLSGTIPAELANLSYLNELSISENQFTGTIPIELGDMPNLIKLLLNDNQLEGSIPSELGNLLNIDLLSLSGNYLSGSIPANLGNLSNLTCMYLDRNQLSGTLPAELGDITNMYHLTVDYNMLEGEIPAEIGNYSNMDYLFISNNQFTHLPDLTGLTSLFNILAGSNYFDFADLERAGIDWSDEHYHYAPQRKLAAPDTLKNGDQLTLIANIGGTGNEYTWFKNGVEIETSTSNTITVTNVTNDYYSCKATNSQFPDLILETLEVYSGESSHGVTLEDYEALVAFYNATNGNSWINNENWLSENTVDQWYGITVENSRVVSIYLNDNNLTGTLPVELQNLEKLYELNLNGNNIGGQIPAELGSLSELNVLYLYNNQFTGEIPSELGNLNSLYVLGLTGNKLQGNVPQELNNLPVAYALLLNNNKLDSLPNLSNVGSSYAGLVYLYTQNNQLTFADHENTGFQEGDINTFIYSPQASLPQYIDTVGSTVTLTVIDESENNSYQWIRNGEVFTGETNSQLSYDVSDASTYYCEVTNSAYPDLTLYTVAVGQNLTQGVLTSHYNALVDLYNATNGDNWTDNESWLSDLPVNAWYGITVVGDRVAEIVLRNNNLSGNLPASLGDLDGLKTLYLYDNEGIAGTIPAEIGNILSLENLAFRNELLTGAVPDELKNLTNLNTLYLNNNTLNDLPDFSGLTNISYCFIEENQFDFSDLDSVNISWTAISPNYSYAPQSHLAAPQYSINGDELVLSVSDSCTDNSFMWFKDDVHIGTTDTHGIIVPFEDFTRYSCTITNARYPELTLFTDTVMVIQRKYEVTFSVTDGENPISDAEVSLSNGEALTTDINGLTQFSLADGVYEYSITKDGYLSHSGTITVDGENFTHDVALLKTYVITFHITVNSEPLQDVQVEIAGIQLFTDADGNLDIELIDGTYGYSIEIEGFQSQVGEVIVDGEDTTVNINLIPLYTVQFIVTDGTNPLSGVTISFEDEMLVTDMSGVATIDTINGTYNYTVTKDGFQTQISDVVVNGSDNTVDIVMQALYTITLTVFDSDSNPIQGAAITFDETTIVTDENGEATLDTINGSYNYRVSMSGYDQVTGTITVNNANTNQSITLQESLETYTVTFNVNDGANPISNATVQLYGYGEIDTNENGLAEFTNVSSGINAYTVTHDGYISEDGAVSINDQDVTENVSLTEITYPLTFSVTTDDMVALEGAIISIDNNVIVTNEFGIATVNLANGSYTYTITLDDYQDVSSSVTIDGAELTEAVTMIEVIVHYMLTFTVKNTEALPIEGAEVTISESTIITDADGKAIFELPNGEYYYSISADNYHTYTGSVMVENAIVNENIILTVSSTGIEQEGLSNILVYPNPASDRIMVKSDFAIETIQLVDVIGKVTYIHKSETNEADLNISKLQKGLYLMRVSYKGGKVEIVRVLIK